jgi:hypothetical protein
MNHHRWDAVFLRPDENDPFGHPAMILSSDGIMADAKQRRYQ